MKTYKVGFTHWSGPFPEEERFHDKDCFWVDRAEVVILANDEAVAVEAARKLFSDEWKLKSIEFPRRGSGDS